MQCDLLNLEWSSSGRDQEVATLICYALRKKGYSVVQESIFNYKYYIIKYNPRILYAGDPKGAKINYRAVKFAHKLGIPVVTVTAEGNYISEELENMFWGHIADKKLIEQLNLQWSTKARKMALQIDPALANQVKVSGAVGFDRYQIYHFDKKEDWANKYGCSYSRIVGYGSWAFDAFYRNDQWAQWRERLYGKEQIAQFREERLKVNEILKQLVERNEDTLFLLKEHPGVVNPDKTELVNLEDYPNVLHIKNEETIADCISVCDIWMAFESTTCLEAWLLGKPTILINPFGGNFVRGNLHKGSPIFRAFEELQGALKGHSESGTIPEFEAKKDERRRIIEETIQWADGKNHLRAAYLIEKLLAKTTQRVIDIKASEKSSAMYENILFKGARFLPFLPRFRTYAAARKRFRKPELNELSRRYRPYLQSFYRENYLTEQNIEELERISL